MGMDKNMSYKWRVLIALDQFGNALVGGAPDETISSRWGRLVRDKGKKAPLYARVGCYLLERIDRGHCHDAIEFDRDGNPNPHHMEGAR